MPDISKCTNSKCELSKHCWRFTCRPKSYMQSYTEYKPKKNNGVVECDNYIQQRDFK